jgi:hypothetical protein
MENRSYLIVTDGVQERESVILALFFTAAATFCRAIQLVSTTLRSVCGTAVPHVQTEVPVRSTVSSFTAGLSSGPRQVYRQVPVRSPSGPRQVPVRSPSGLPSGPRLVYRLSKPSCQPFPGTPSM